MKSHAGGAGRLDVSMCPCVHAALQAARPQPAPGPRLPDLPPGTPQHTATATRSAEPPPPAPRRRRYSRAAIHTPHSPTRATARQTAAAALQLCSEQRQQTAQRVKHQTSNRKQETAKTTRTTQNQPHPGPGAPQCTANIHAAGCFVLPHACATATARPQKKRRARHTGATHSIGVEVTVSRGGRGRGQGQQKALSLAAFIARPRL